MKQETKSRNLKFAGILLLMMAAVLWVLSYFEKYIDIYQLTNHTYYFKLIIYNYCLVKWRFHPCICRLYHGSKLFHCSTFGSKPNHD